MRKFQRKIENFICENCKTKIIGNGYTNHCSNCFYSKHVDIYPGDRLSLCNGLMKPIEVTLKNGNYIILHECTKCGHLKKNKLSPIDDVQKLLKIVYK